MEPLEILATALCAAAVLSYLLAGGLLALKKRRTAVCFAAFGWLSNLGIFVKNWYINGYAPFASMYQVLSVLSLCFLVIFVLMSAAEKNKRWLLPYFCFASAVPLIGTLFMDRQIKWSLVPALQAGWFVPHVFSYVLSYALAAVAFILTLVCFFRRDRSERYKDAIYTVLRLSFPFMVTGLTFGALWADQVWGNYWQWDVKEIWSLITCMLYLGYFHARLSEKLRRYALGFAVLGFAALIVTFLCINLLPNMPGSLHTYA